MLLSYHIPRYEPNYGYGMGAKYAIGYHALPRYQVFLKKTYGVDASEWRLLWRGEEGREPAG
jgi:hypothetical protein